MATQVQKPQQANGIAPPKKPAAAARAPAVKQPNAPTGGASRPTPKKRAANSSRKAASVAGHESPSVTSAYTIMAGRLANRVAELAEGITFVERQKPNQLDTIDEQERKKPRKLDMRLQKGSPDSIAFSAPFLDNTLQKMLLLQNRMLTTTADLSKADGVSEKVIKEHASQSAELSRIIALICAEKARQGS